MKKIIKYLTFTIAVIYVTACQDNSLQTENTKITAEILSHDSDFNALVNTISKLESSINSTTDNMSSSERGENLRTLQSLLHRKDNLTDKDMTQISTIFGYSNPNSLAETLKQAQALGQIVASKFPEIQNQTDDEKKVLIESAIQKTDLFTTNGSNLRMGTCNRKMLAACIASAYGVCVVVITSNCPAAAVFGPWGVGACVAGATLTYGAALYMCGDAYGCN